MQRFFILSIICMVVTFCSFLKPGIGECAAAKTVQDLKSTALTVKIALYENDVETSADEYNFMLSNGEQGVYESTARFPYWPKHDDNSPNYTDETLKILVTPQLTKASSVIDLQIEGSLVSFSIKNDVSASAHNSFFYQGSSVLTDDQLLEVFSGKIGKEQGRKLKIFVKSKESIK